MFFNNLNFGATTLEGCAIPAAYAPSAALGNGDTSTKFLGLVSRLCELEIFSPETIGYFPGMYQPPISRLPWISHTGGPES
jgi:hypothetical protein